MAPNRRFRKNSESSFNHPRSKNRRSFGRGEDRERGGSDNAKGLGKKSWTGKRDNQGREGRSGIEKRGFGGGRNFGKKPWAGKREYRQRDDDRGRAEQSGQVRPGFDRGRDFGKKSWTGKREYRHRDDDRGREDSGKQGFDRGIRPGRPGFRGRSGDKKGDRGQRPFYKQGFGRRRQEGESGGRDRRASEGGERKSFVDSRMDRARKVHGHRRHEEKAADPDGLIRLNKFISNSGVCSRREADNLITMGLITVNGKAITELGHKVKATDDVRYEGRKLSAERMVYILLNKPKGYITTTDDPQERNTVMHILEGACKERIYPVGRLDRNTSGLLLLTNDGELTDKLTHPSYNIKKIYKAELDKPLTKADFQKIREGVKLEEGTAMVDDLAVISEDGKTIGLEIHIGWNRVIRRIFEVLGYDVVKLDRTVYATLDKKDLPRGHWRFLRQEEVVRLKHFQ